MAESLPMKREIGITDARKNLSELVNRVHRKKEHLVVEKLGIPVVAVISIEDYERYQRLLAEKSQDDQNRAVNSQAENQMD